MSETPSKKKKMSERRTLLLIKKISYKLDFKALLLTLLKTKKNPQACRVL